MSVKVSVKANLKKIRIGTRGSPLALVQAHMVRDELSKIDQKIETEIVVIKTSGDWAPEHGEVKLQATAGGKGLFAKELEAALLSGDIDVAVHSMKDMEAQLPEELMIGAMLPREDVRDVFLSNIAQNIDELPKGSIVGTVSPRREAFLRARRPDLKIMPLRGNVQTRIDKMNAGQVDATLLACAGLKRLGVLSKARSMIPVEEILPSVGQGAIGVEMRQGDDNILSIISQLSCKKTMDCVLIERGFLRGLGGSCHTPIGVYAVYEGHKIRLRASLLSPDGRQRIDCDEVLSPSDLNLAIRTAEDLGRQMRRKAPEGSLNG